MAWILVIEDEKPNRLVVGELLKAQGHTVKDAVDGGEGIRLHQDYGFDLIITDIVMAFKAGLETIEELHAAYLDLKILAMSGHKGGLLEAALEAGAMAILEKPFTPEELLRSVEDCLRRDP